jgi:hypothetical protein
MFAAFAGVTIAVAARASSWWPFAVIFAVTGSGYLLGLSTYGVGEEVPADDQGEGLCAAQARGPEPRKGANPNRISSSG